MVPAGIIRYRPILRPVRYMRRTILLLSQYGTVFITMLETNKSWICKIYIMDMYALCSGGGGRTFEAPPLFANITRIGTSVEAEKEEVQNEKHRIRTGQMTKEARLLADEKKLVDAQKKLVEAEKMLGGDVVGNPVIETLKSELQQLLKLMASQDIYEKEGRAFALSLETSLNLQRAAARGTEAQQAGLFETPRMDALRKQAESYDKDPSRPPPTVDEDVEEEHELVSDPPIASVVNALKHFIQNAIQFLKSLVGL